MTDVSTRRSITIENSVMNQPPKHIDAEARKEKRRTRASLRLESNEVQDAITLKAREFRKSLRFNEANKGSLMLSQDLQRVKKEIQLLKTKQRILQINEDYLSINTNQRNSQYCSELLYRTSTTRNLTTRQQFIILQLEDKILLHILSYLELKDVASAAKVCTRLHKLSKTRNLWQGFYICYIDNYCQESKKKEDDDGDFNLIEEEREYNEESANQTSLSALVQNIASTPLNKMIQRLTSPFGPIAPEDVQSFLTAFPSVISSERLILKLVKRFQQANSASSEDDKDIEWTKRIEAPIQHQVCTLVYQLVEHHSDLLDKNSLVLLHLFFRGYVKDEKLASNSLKLLSEKTNPRLKNTQLLTRTQTLKSLGNNQLQRQNILLDLDASALAAELSRAEHVFFRSLNFNEFSSLITSQKRSLNSSSTIKLVEQRFDHMCRWVSTVILSSPDQKIAQQTICKIIEIAKTLRDLNNYHLLMAFVLALNNGPVSRLKDSFSKLPKTHQRIFKELQELCSVEGHHKAYRNALANTKGAAIPYLGVFFKDLSMCTDVAKQNPDRSVLNWGNNKKAEKIIQQVQQFQREKFTINSLSTNTPIPRGILSINLLNDEQLSRASYRLESSQCGMFLNNSHSNPTSPMKDVTNTPYAYHLSPGGAHVSPSSSPSGNKQRPEPSMSKAVVMKEQKQSNSAVSSPSTSSSNLLSSSSSSSSPAAATASVIHNNNVNNENKQPVSPPASPSKSITPTKTKEKKSKSLVASPFKLFKKSLSAKKLNSDSPPSKSKSNTSSNGNHNNNNSNNDSNKSYLIDFSQAAIDFNEPLGKGGSASGIYRAVVKGFTFAAKHFDISAVTSEELEPIQREVDIMDLLSEHQHPNIATYLGSHVVPDQQICIFMEFYMESLNSFIKKKRETQTHFTANEILELAIQMAEGLNFLHNVAHIVHLDLKSENIFLVRSMHNRAVLKLGDFGEAQVLKSADDLCYRVNAGTTEFRAPEVFGMMSVPSKGYTTNADVWSFGMVLFELLTLDIPYRAENIDHFALPRKIEAGIRPQLPDVVTSQMNEEAPIGPEILRVFERCTTKDANQRLTSSQLLELLNNLKKSSAN